MSDGETSTIPIACPRGCGRPSTAIGTTPKTLRFRYVPANQGEMIDIEGLDGPPFSNKRREPPFVMVDYAGSGPAPQKWTYRPVGEPACADPEAAAPELTNEPKGEVT